eukprot:jgi/Mesen1/2384/ME001565S01387
MALAQKALFKGLLPVSSGSAASLSPDEYLGKARAKAVSVVLKSSFNGAKLKLSNSKAVKLAELPKKVGICHEAPHVSGVRASVGGVADERDSDSADFNFIMPTGKMMVPEMKKGYGAFGGGATLEKSKLNLSQSQTKSSPQLDVGGGGGNLGNKNFNGGGDGGDDDGDDDDYMGEDDDGDGDGDGFLRRGAIAELFDRETVEAVLKEWYKSMRDLPAGMKQALELGLISSAQMVRFMSVNARPTVARSVSRLAPEDLSRAFIGRMVADPAFIFKLALEQAITIGTTVHWEYKQRGSRLKEEWDLAALNVLTLAACNFAVVWTCSPSRSYGTTAKSDWQNVLQKLPNHAFDKSYPLMEFNMQKRVGGFFYKAAELSLVGSLLGAAGGAANPDFYPAVTVPTVGTSALAMGAFLGLSGNLRYQLVGGADRWMQTNLNAISLSIFGTSLLRVLNNRLGEPSRLMLMGIDEAPTTYRSAAGAGTATDAYHRPSAAKKQGTTFSVPGLPGTVITLPALPDFSALIGSGSSRRSSAPQGSSSTNSQKRRKRRVAVA